MDIFRAAFSGQPGPDQPPRPEPTPEEIEAQQFRQMVAQYEALQYVIFQFIGETIFLRKNRALANERIQLLESFIERSMQSIEAVKRANREIPREERIERLRREQERIQAQIEAVENGEDAHEDPGVSTSEADEMRAELERFLADLPTTASGEDSATE